MDCENCHRPRSEKMLTSRSRALSPECFEHFDFIDGESYQAAKDACSAAQIRWQQDEIERLSNDVNYQANQIAELQAQLSDAQLALHHALAETPDEVLARMVAADPQCAWWECPTCHGIFGPPQGGTDSEDCDSCWAHKRKGARQKRAQP